jgi:hypothetical protein
MSSRINVIRVIDETELSTDKDLPTSEIHVPVESGRYNLGVFTTPQDAFTVPMFQQC